MLEKSCRPVSTTEGCVKREGPLSLNEALDNFSDLGDLGTCDLLEQEASGTGFNRISKP